MASMASTLLPYTVIDAFYLGFLLLLKIINLVFFFFTLSPLSSSFLITFLTFSLTFAAALEQGTRERERDLFNVRGGR